MLRQKQQLFEALFLAADLFVVTVAWLVAYWLRFEVDLVPVEKGVPPFSNYLSMLLFIWLIWAFVFKRFGLYRPMRAVRRSREIWQLINANIVALLLFIAVTYLFREKAAPFSRLVFLTFGLLAICLTAFHRVALRTFLREIRRRGHNLRYMLVIGAGKVAGDIISRVRLRREMGIQVIGCLSETGEEKSGPRGAPIVGSYSDLGRLIKELDVDQILIALPLEDNHYLPDVIEVLKDSVVDVKIVPDIYQFISVGGTIEEFEGLPLIGVQDTPLEGGSRLVKRFFDLVIAVIIILIIAPFLLLIALLVKLTSHGPVFYRQQRVSVDGSSFTIYKFRTMCIDAEAGGPGWTKPGDCRVTPIGKVLRRFSLDELPQLLNVILGDMSIVGPRPERPVFIEEFRRRVPRYMLRHKVPAGITGWAQVNGWRGDTSIDKRIEYDLYYIENWSLLLDLKIIFLTLVRGFGFKNAY